MAKYNCPTSGVTVNAEEERDFLDALSGCLLLTPEEEKRITRVSRALSPSRLHLTTEEEKRLAAISDEHFYNEPPDEREENEEVEEKYDPKTDPDNY